MKTEREKMLAGELYQPMDAELVEGRARARDLCRALSSTREAEQQKRRIEIGSDVWVGGGAIILPGARIGSRAVIGAGSVVSRDIPEGMFAAGNPCRVLREITQ